VKYFALSIKNRNSFQINALKKDAVAATDQPWKTPGKDDNSRHPDQTEFVIFSG
jgi:hypothetical protein